MKEVYIRVSVCSKVIKGYFLKKIGNSITILLPCGIICVPEETCLSFPYTSSFSCRFCKEANDH